VVSNLEVAVILLLYSGCDVQFFWFIVCIRFTLFYFGRTRYCLGFVCDYWRVSFSLCIYFSTPFCFCCVGLVLFSFSWLLVFAWWVLWISFGLFVVYFCSSLFFLLFVHYCFSCGFFYRCMSFCLSVYTFFFVVLYCFVLISCLRFGLDLFRTGIFKFLSLSGMLFYWV